MRLKVSAFPPLRRSGNIAFPPALAALGVTLLAFGLRLYRLADKNVWWDEGWTLWLSRLDLAQIALRTANDEHPPLHYWLMHFWLAGSGGSAFAGRLFSVFLGVLGIALLFRLVKHIGGGRLGVLAALLLAISRFHILWSQDIKNYTLAGFFALGSLWCTFLLFADRPGAAPRRRWLWLGYVAASMLAIYSHYLAALALLANNLFAALALGRQWLQGQRRPWQDLVRWAAAQVAVLAGFAPWLFLYWRNAPSWAAAPIFDFGFFLRLTATIFTLGVTTHIEDYAVQVVFFVILASIGLAWLVRDLIHRGHPSSGSASHRNRLALGALLGLILISVPPLFIYILSLTPVAMFHPKIQPRYLLVFLPGYILLLTLGIGWLIRLSKPLGLALLAVVVGMQIPVLADYYQGRKLHDDYFTLANTINAFARPGDSVLLYTDQEWPTFLYYLREPIPWGGVPSQPMTEKQAIRLAAHSASSSTAVWVVTIPDALERDAQHLLPAQLAASRPKQFERLFGDSLLTLYAPTPRDLDEVPAENFAPQHPGAVSFAPQVQLVGYDLATRELNGGDTVRLVTYWSAATPVTVTLEIRDANDAVVRADSQAVRPGLRHRLQSDLPLPPRAAGAYSLVARAYNQTHALASLAVTSQVRTPPAEAIHNPLDYRLGEAISLRGYNLPQAILRPGEGLRLTLFWYSRQPTPVSYKVFVQLLGTEFNADQNNFLWGQVDDIPLEGAFPTTMWEPGDLLADHYGVHVDPAAPAGPYQLLVGMYDPVTGQRLRLTSAAGQDLGDAIQIGTVTVTPPDTRPTHSPGLPPSPSP